MWKATLKGLLAHKLRLALTAVAIVIGVMFVSGTFVLTDTLHNTFTTLFNGIYQHVDFEVRGKAAFTGQSGIAVRNPIPQSVGQTVSRVPGVEDAVGGVQGFAQLVAPDGKSVNTNGAPTLGVSFNPVSQMAALHLRNGTPPTTPHNVVIDAATATKYHFHIGDRVRVLFTGPPQTFTLTGIVRFGTANNLAGATIAAFDLPTAQTLFNRVGQYDAIDVLAEPGVNLAQLQRSIAQVLPHNVEVVTGQTVANENVNSINQAFLGFFSTALLVFAFISLFVGSFTIFNTFSIIVGQRTRELAMLRILGASRRQIFRSVLAEAAVVGLVASLVGLALGVLAAVGLEALLNAFNFDLPSGGLVFGTRTVIVGLVVGIGVTVVSAVSPARRAVRIPPVAALSDHDVSATESSRRRGHRGERPRPPRCGRPGRGPHRPGDPTGGTRCRGDLHRHRHARPSGGPTDGQRHRPALGGDVRHGGEAGSGKLDAQSPAHGADGGGADRSAWPSSPPSPCSARRSRGRPRAASTRPSAPTTSSSARARREAATGRSARSTASAAGRVLGVTAASTVYTGEFLFHGSLSTLTAISADRLAETIILRMDSGTGAPALAAGELLVDTTTADNDHLTVGSSVPSSSPTPETPTSAWVGSTSRTPCSAASW